MQTHIGPVLCTLTALVFNHVGLEVLVPLVRFISFGSYALSIVAERVCKKFRVLRSSEKRARVWYSGTHLQSQHLGG